MKPIFSSPSNSYALALSVPSTFQNKLALFSQLRFFFQKRSRVPLVYSFFPTFSKKAAALDVPAARSGDSDYFRELATSDGEPSLADVEGEEDDDRVQEVYPRIGCLGLVIIDMNELELLKSSSVPAGRSR